MIKKNCFSILWTIDIIKCGILAICLNILLEILNRRSLLQCLKFIFHSPIVFIYNAILVFLTLSIGLLAKRKIFTVSIISFFWIVLGTANCIILGFRTTPFSAIDTLMLKNSRELIHAYLTFWEIAGIAFLLLLSITVIVILWFRAPKRKTRADFYKYIAAIFIIAAIEFGFTKINISIGILSGNFDNLAIAYETYGFAYCFTNSIVDVGISQPNNYNKKTMLTLKTSLQEANNNTSTDFNEEKPNIIIIQLESFFDVNNINDVTFSENPIPNFTELEKDYSSGFLTVPTIGAGTANTEFEVLTGMNTDFFGAGEYPYKTIMRKHTAESMAYLLKNLGYSTHGIHNNDGTFYNRNEVFANLGFDTFTPVEYMYHIEKTATGWAKDNILPEEINKCLNSSSARDFIFTVSVQAHGRYPSVAVDDSQTITASGNKEQQAELEYYVNQIHQDDIMIGTLIDQLKERNEPTILVLYGDHLPALGLTENRLKNANLFQTSYVIWNNIGLSKTSKNMYSYQLSTYLFEQLGYPLGIIQECHQEYENSKQYKKNLKLLEYDMLYGQQYIFDNQTSPYVAADLKMGIDTITLDSIQKINSEKKAYYITGQNFNDCTKIYVNSKQADTEYIDSNTLKITGKSLESGDTITSAQIGETHVPLGYSNELTFH